VRTVLGRRAPIAALAIGAVVISAFPAAAQEAAPPVLILPADRADFLAGQTFDLRVEVHADALPDDFAVTINGTPAAELLGAEGTPETWTFGDEAAPTPAQSVVWRDVTIDTPGEVVVEVTAGGETTTADWEIHPGHPAAGAKNVILFIADGMSVPAITAARVASKGNPGGKFNGYFTMDQMPVMGLLNTSGLDSIITDSANSASSYNTGHKGAVGALGTYPDTSPDTLDDPKVETFAELVKRTRDMSVGIVTTADWTDATPAAVFAHTRDRGDREEIAAVPLDSGLLPEVIMGGGGRYMLPETIEGGRRTDGRNLFDEYEAAGYTVVTDATSLAGIDPASTEHLLGLFHSSDMNVWLDRNVYTDNLGDFADQPGLVEMTETALEVLAKDPDGFYLEVEAASVDKQMHPLDQERALADLIEFDQAIGAAVAWAAENAPDTLIVVTADHGHGYEVFGTVDVEAFNAASDDAGKLSAIGIYEAAGFPTYEDADGDGFPDDWDVSRTLAGLVNNHPAYTEDFQVSSVPRVPAIVGEDGVAVDNPDDDPNGLVMNATLPTNSPSGVHTLQDVPVFAAGPGAEQFAGVDDNTSVFFKMAAAIGLDPTVEGGEAAGGAMTEATCEGVSFGGACFVQ
jgi:alkaline phosphatase